MAGFLGKIISVTVGVNKIQCETNAVLNLESDTVDLDLCKDETFASSLPGSMTWSIDVDGNALLNAAEVNQLDIIEAMIARETVTVEFGSTPGEHSFDEDFTLSGEATITSFSWDNPSADASTWSATFSGSGQLTLVRTPATT